MTRERFHDRADAGRRLGEALAPDYQNRSDVIVLGLPRGGVPVAWEVAQLLGAPLDVFLVRKLGFPRHPELAMGAIASGGVRVLNEDVLREVPIAEDTIAAVAAEEQTELERRERLYRSGRPELDLAGRTVILVDDGLATGATMRAAAAAVRTMDPAELVVAVPVAAAVTCEQIEPEVDRMLCLHTPDPFRAVGLWYEEFGQTPDDEVQSILRRAEEELPPITAGSRNPDGEG